MPMGPGVTRKQITATAELKRRAALPTNAIDETIPRTSATSGSVALGVTGRLSLIGVVELPAGKAVTTVTAMSGTTAMVTPANQWFTLIRVSDLAILGKTADDTTTAWAVSAFKTLTLSAAYTPSANELAYVGVVISAATMPTVTGVATTSVSNGIAPILVAWANSALTNPASLVTVSALTAVSAFGYAYVS